MRGWDAASSEATPRNGKGSLVARKRPTASDVTLPALICLDGGRPPSAIPALTRAEAQALKRSAPLTHQQLRKHLQGIPQPPIRGV